jgi:DNA-binding FrmR family transcriptional regulator
VGSSAHGSPSAVSGLWEMGETAMLDKSTPPRQVFWDADDVIQRLRRIEGQVRGIQAMVERRDACQAILVQVAAVEGGIREIGRIVSACSVAEALTGLSAAPPDPDAVRAALKRTLSHR